MESRFGLAAQAFGVSVALERSLEDEPFAFVHRGG
jgi:hypothetical protein